MLFVCNVYSDNKQKVLAQSLRVDEARNSNIVSCMRRIGNIGLICECMLLFLLLLHIKQITKILLLNINTKKIFLI